jgi:hypothetical protein
VDNAISIAKFSDIRFGTLGTVDIIGTGHRGEHVRITMPLSDIGPLVTRLMHIAAVSLYSDQPGLPERGTEVPIAFAPVSVAHPFAAKDIAEPCLRVHSCGCTFHFHFPQSVAEECGKGLLAIAAASAAPDVSKTN